MLYKFKLTLNIVFIPGDVVDGHEVLLRSHLPLQPVDHSARRVGHPGRVQQLAHCTQEDLKPEMPIAVTSSVSVKNRTNNIYIFYYIPVEERNLKKQQRITIKFLSHFLSFGF